MNLRHVQIRASKIMTVILALWMFCWTPTAMAASNPMHIMEKLTINGKDLDYTRTADNDPPVTTTIRSAKVTLSPPNATGTLETIMITGPEGLEFGCSNIKVKNGIDLIKACGGPATLKAGGSTTYKVTGKEFGPESQTIITVDLSDDF